MNENVESSEKNLRKSQRVKARIPVDVSEGSTRCAFGEVVNISRDGMAVDAFPLLLIGKVYRFHLRGFGTFPGSVVRRFGIKCHGVRFEIDDVIKRRIDEDILGL